MEQLHILFIGCGSALALQDATPRNHSIQLYKYINIYIIMEQLHILFIGCGSALALQDATPRSRVCSRLLQHQPK
jgi:hypothetical protein